MFSKIILISAIIFSLIGCTPGSSDSSEESFAPTWESCSQQVSDHPCNFTLMNQAGEEVSLYDFYGSPIILDFSAGWCGPCKMAGSEVQDVANEYGESNLVYITVLIEDASGNAPDVSDLSAWAIAYGIEEPVLAGDRSLIDISGESGWPISSWPTFFFITDEMVIKQTLKGFSSAYIDALTQNLIGS